MIYMLLYLGPTEFAEAGINDLLQVYTCDEFLVLFIDYRVPCI